MIFLFIRQSDIGGRIDFGIIEADTPALAAADPKIGCPIERTDGKKHYLKVPAGHSISRSDWILEEIEWLTEQPKRLRQMLELV